MTVIRGRNGLRVRVPADPEQRKGAIAAAVVLFGALLGLAVIGLLLLKLLGLGGVL